MLKDVRGAILLGALGAQGRIRLTTQRLAFSHRRIPFIIDPRADFVIELGDIVTARRLSRWHYLYYFGPRPIEVTGRNGERYVFQAMVWRELQRARESAPGTVH